MLWRDDGFQAQGVQVLRSLLSLIRGLIRHAALTLERRPGIQPRPAQIAMAKRALEVAEWMRSRIWLSPRERVEVDANLDRIVLELAALRY